MKSFKYWLEQEWKRDMGVPNQLDNPTMDKAMNRSTGVNQDNGLADYEGFDDTSQAGNADPQSSENIEALKNHLRALHRLVTRIHVSKKFYGLEDSLQKKFNNFKNELTELIDIAYTRRINSPQVNQFSQGVSLNAQNKPEMLNKIKGEEQPSLRG